MPNRTVRSFRTNANQLSYSPGKHWRIISTLINSNLRNTIDPNPASFSAELLVREIGVRSNPFNKNSTAGERWNDGQRISSTAASSLTMMALAVDMNRTKSKKFNLNGEFEDRSLHRNESRSLLAASFCAIFVLARRCSITQRVRPRCVGNGCTTLN